MSEILVIGSINVDYVSYVDQMPAKGETIIAKDFKIGPGGKGNNMASSMRTLNAQVNLLGAIGKDSNGNYLRAEMEKKGLSTDLLVEIDSAPTGMAFITVDAKADNTIVVSSGANSYLRAQHVTDEILKRHSVVCGSLENPQETLIDIFRRARALKVTTVLNFSPSFTVAPALFENTDIFVSNKREFEKIVDFYGVHTLKEFQSKFGCKAVIVTLGKTGVSFCQGGEEEFLPGFIIDNVVDTAGAGDFFLASFLTRYTQGWSLVESIDFGQKGGALSVTQKGTQHNITFMDIEKLDLPRRTSSNLSN